MGTAPPGDTYNESGNGTPMIAGAGDYGDTFPKPKKWTTRPTRIANTGDLLVCVRATIGDLNWADRDYCLGRGVAGIRARNGKADLRYIAHFMESQKADLARLGTGSTFLAIRKADLEGFAIPLPPLPEQKRIAAILDKADAIRRKRQEGIKLTEQFLRSVFLDMFGDPVTNPKGWPVVPFNSVCESRLGKMLDANQQVGDNPRPYMRNINVQWGRLDLSTVWEMDFDAKDRKQFRLMPNDVLICEGGAGVAQTAVWRGEIGECYFQKSLHRVRPMPDLATSEFIAYLIRMLMREGSELSRLVSSATIPHLTGVKLKTMKTPVPPISLQRVFSDLACRNQALQVANARRFDVADGLFNSLVQRAFRGEL